MRARLSYFVCCFLIALGCAKHCRPCHKESNQCGRCPIDPKTRVAELVDIFNSKRKNGYFQEICLLDKDFVGYVRFREAQCQVLTYPFPQMLYGYDYYYLHDDDWIQERHDGSIVVTFSIIELRKTFTPKPNAAQIVQTWVPAEGICNYLMKQENYTDYRCFSVNQ